MTKTKETGASLGLGCLALTGVIAILIAVWAAWVAVISLVFMWAWNLVVPAVFGGPTLDFGAAFALMLVTSIIGRLLFGGRSSTK